VDVQRWNSPAREIYDNNYNLICVCCNRYFGGLSALVQLSNFDGELDLCGEHNITADVEVIPSRKSTKPTSGC